MGVGDGDCRVSRWRGENVVAHEGGNLWSSEGMLNWSVLLLG